LLLSLNLAPARRFGNHASDGLATVFAGGHTWRTDADGHHYRLDGHRPSVTELRLRVSDITCAIAFYRDVLGLELLEVTACTARLATGSVPIVLELGRLAVDGRPVRHDTYLLVFHTADINQMCASLTANGVHFSGRKVGQREIGYTIRFTDPSGNRYCLYEPSEEVLTWSSGPRVRQIVGDRLP
jgi:predicted enzyme related to lactoylglutathione lyase